MVKTWAAGHFTMKVTTVFYLGHIIVAEIRWQRGEKRTFQIETLFLQKEQKLDRNSRNGKPCSSPEEKADLKNKWSYENTQGLITQALYGKVTN
jgi:hypothetical protein